jgi:hypothetical protein
MAYKSMDEPAPLDDRHDPSNPRIVKTEDVLDRKARIERCRISVFISMIGSTYIS